MSRAENPSVLNNPKVQNMKKHLIILLLIASMGFVGCQSNYKKVTELASERNYDWCGDYAMLLPDSYIGVSYSKFVERYGEPYSVQTVTNQSGSILSSKNEPYDKDIIEDIVDSVYSSSGSHYTCRVAQWLVDDLRFNKMTVYFLQDGDYKSFWGINFCGYYQNTIEHLF